MKSHVEWLELVIKNTTEECRAGTSSTKMLEAMNKEYKFHCQHLLAEEMALKSWRYHSNYWPELRKELRKKAVSAHSELGCSPICSFWHCMQKGKRPESYKVNFFCEETDNCLWPGVVYEANH